MKDPIAVDLTSLRDKIEKAKNFREAKDSLLEAFSWIFGMMTHTGILMLQHDVRMEQAKDDLQKAKAGICHLLCLMAMSVHKMPGSPDSYQEFERDLRQVFRTHFKMDVRTIGAKVDEKTYAKLKEMSPEQLADYVREEMKRMN